MKCTETFLADAASPDGAWKAAEYEQVCEGFLVTHITAVVRLTSATDAKQSVNVLGVSANTPDERPRLTWTAPLSLQIKVPHSLSLKVLTCEFDGVRIDVRLPADDAANRAAWYRQLGQSDPDPGGLLAQKCP
jgi:hypothetical protein